MAGLWTEEVQVGLVNYQMESGGFRSQDVSYLGGFEGALTDAK